MKIMTNHELKSTLRRLSRRTGKLPAEWKLRNREILLMQIRNSVASERPRLTPAHVRLFVRLFVPTHRLGVFAKSAFSFVLVVGVVLGSWITTGSAAVGTLPGDLLYPWKLATEAAQVALSPDAATRAKLHVDFAERRLEELARLPGRADRNFNERVRVTVNRFGNEVRAVNKNLDELRDIEPSTVVAIAEVVDRKMAEYDRLLTMTKPQIKPSSVAVFEAGNLIDEAGARAVEVIAQKHAEGLGSVSESLVARKVGERIRRVAERATAVRGELTQLASSGGSAATSSLAAANQAEGSLAEAKELLGKKDFVAALVKVREGNDFVAEAQKMTEAAGTGLDSAESDAASSSVESATSSTP
ncbi:MAG: DUF5667 domain-containing protein [Patescibacteria group bacterium]